MADFPRRTTAHTVTTARAVSGALLVLLTLALLPGCRAQQTPPPPPAPLGPPTPLWTDAERAACVTFWSQPGRTRVFLLPPRAGLTPAASLWFAAYGRSMRTASPADAVAWKAWVDAKLARDRWEASGLAGEPTGPEPPAPGVIPASLLLAAGDPPPLSSALAPRRYSIDLGDGPPLTYVAPIPVSPRSRFFRSAEGVISDGSPLRDMPRTEIDGLMRAAGLTPFEAHVVAAVSRLEGGFDAVNTYDTGFVSVGFIQFITAAGGDGSLATVLATEKAADPADFARDFHGRGVDVTPAGVFAALDPATGAELAGADAVRKTITDPRLVAVFQSAGQRSRTFRIAQIQTAKHSYYPAADPVSVTLGDGTVLTGRVADILHSEAGMATAFDRKVNTGHAAPEVAAAAASVMAAHGLRTLADLVPFEREVAAALKYRTDFLADPDLTQPPAAPAVPTGQAPTPVGGGA